MSEEKKVWHGKGLREQINPENTKMYKSLTWEEASARFKEIMSRRPEPVPYTWFNYCDTLGKIGMYSMETDPCKDPKCPGCSMLPKAMKR